MLRLYNRGKKEITLSRTVFPCKERCDSISRPEADAKSSVNGKKFLFGSLAFSPFQPDFEARRDRVIRICGASLEGNWR
jgi:hypothetical protein